MLIVFDENQSVRIAEGLRILESGNRKSPVQTQVKLITELTDRRASYPRDTEVIGEHGGNYFTKDKDFKTVKLLKTMFKEHKVGVVFFKQHKNGLSYWENV
jgi:hypothetical protein